MATLALSAAGAAIGGAVIPSVSIFGATLTGAAIGQAVGGLAGATIDQALFASSGQARQVEGPRLTDLRVMASSEGAPVARVYGRARVAGQLIWATELEEEVVEVSQTPSGSGKGLGGASTASASETEYRYYANFAVGLCEGRITRIGRIWADGSELRLADLTYRVHHGDETQQPDSLIEAKLGAGNAPAYRGLAYVVFERLPLAAFGNRLPQLAFEVVRAVDGFEERIRSITIIPGATEFGYQPTEVIRDSGFGGTAAENVHTFSGRSDWDVAVDELTDLLPNLDRAALVVGWFGDDLRAGSCSIRPGVESIDKITLPDPWQAGGVARTAAHVVSTHDGRPAYGGTPSDASVKAAIADLRARGLAVTYYPFLLMDVPGSSGRPDPYGALDQPAYPWRGRITLSTAPGRPGSPDQTAQAAEEIGSFVGTCSRSDFSIVEGRVVYHGPAEWSYRRFILHAAWLCKAAGGVDTFLIGSEMRGLTTARSARSDYPFVDALVTLAADVKAVLGNATKVTYAADWSEYFGHQPRDGSGDVHFHLDPLWASAAIDAVGIDLYWPLSDWRDGDDHLDLGAGATGPHDLGYLRANVFAGEGFDWYYASAAARDAQARSPITDGAGKPWLFRYKDIRSWWLNQHFDRPGGVERSTPTAWMPQSKPFWFTEIGCPAIDRGANQPNVFYDPKSSESRLPYYSRGVRDDLMQRRYLEAVLGVFDPADPDFAAVANPISAVYGGRMVDHTRATVYTWDARPYPAFPYASAVWSDGTSWPMGHWLTGRLASGSLARVVGQILDDYGFARYSAAGLVGTVDGYVVDRVMSARAALQPLELAYGFDSLESAGLVRFAHRGGRHSVARLTLDDLVEGAADDELIEVVRSQESELPSAAKITFSNGSRDYRVAAVEARHGTTSSSRVALAELPIVMSTGQAQSIANRWLRDTWATRSRTTFALPPGRLALEPTDVVTVSIDGVDQRMRVTAITDGLTRSVEALTLEPAVFEEHATPDVEAAPPLPETYGQSTAVLLDLPLLGAEVDQHAGHVAAYQSPWPGAVALYRSAGAERYALNVRVGSPATFGTLVAPLAAGPTGRFDYANRIEVELLDGILTSVDESRLLDGDNTAAIEGPDGDWEVVQFASVELIAPRRYRLGKLLRGQAGTEQAMRAPAAIGARLVILDRRLARVAMSRDDVGRSFQWAYGPANRPLGHLSYQNTTWAFRGVGLRPLSPVHIRGRRSAAGLDIAWVRRTRIGGDSWEGLEVPLAEERELYEVDILDGSTVRRTLRSERAAASYGVDEQIADWGAVRPAYEVRVYQVSPSYGRGTAGAATL